MVCSVLKVGLPGLGPKWTVTANMMRQVPVDLKPYRLKEAKKSLIFGPTDTPKKTLERFLFAGAMPVRRHEGGSYGIARLVDIQDPIRMHSGTEIGGNR